MSTRRIALSFVLLCAAGCGGNGGASDGGPDGLPLDERLGSGEVRAGVITRETELLEGPEAHGWLGDVKMYNAEVAFVIQGIEDVRSFGYHGGSLLDADRVRAEGTPGDERLQEIFGHVNLLNFAPDSLQIVSDGSGDTPAQVQVTGRHHGIPPLDAALSGAVTPLDLEMVRDYLLEADSAHLTIRTSLRNRAASGVHVTAGDVVLAGDATTHAVPGSIISAHDAMPSGDHAWYAGFAPRVCYLYTAVEGTVHNSFSLHEVAILTAAEGTAPALRSDDPSLVIERRLLVGDGGLDSCLRLLANDGDPAGLIAGNVTDEASAAEAGLPVYAFDPGRPEGKRMVNQTYTSSDGSFAMELAPGTYRIVVEAPVRGEYAVDDVVVQAGRTTPLDFTLPRPALVNFHCEEQRAGGDKVALPCKVSLQTGHDAGMGDPVHMPVLHFGAGGSGTFEVPPGDWTVTFSHGWEYSIQQENLTASAGETAVLGAILLRQVDTAGWIAIDPHSHSTRSIDSTYDIADKVASNMCEGVEIMVVTDHDCQTDVTPWLERMRAGMALDPDDWIRPVVGIEISPHYGHSTAFPLPTHPAGWVYWQIPYARYKDNLFVSHIDYPELWPRARELGAAVINLAHPLSHNAWFDYLGIDPAGDIPRFADLPPGKFSDDFDTIELLNGDDVDDMLGLVLPVWSAMNNQGMFKTAVGVSDVHQRDAEAGFGRTLVASSEDVPDRVDLDEVWQNLRAGRAAVGAGLFVQIAVDDTGPGGLAAASPPFEVHIRVQAADWIPAANVTLLANGDEVVTLPLAGPGEVDPARPALRLDQRVPVDPAVDSWYAALALGAENDRLDPVFRGCRPAGLTNAVRVDVDGNGRFDPPEP